MWDFLTSGHSNFHIKQFLAYEQKVTNYHLRFSKVKGKLIVKWFGKQESEEVGTMIHSTRVQCL
jgi:hypothetical protein